MEATWSLSATLSFPNHLFQCITKGRLLQLLKVYAQIKIALLEQVNLNNAVSHS